MAPLLSGVWWGPEAGVVGSGAAAASGVASWLGSEQLILVITLSVLAALLLVSVLLMLCASCQGQKKTINGHPAGDHENLMNGVSEKETISQSADSPATDVAVSSSHNGPLTSGTILTDTQDTSPQPSEEMLSSQSELRSSKCPQDRELPSIPPNNALIGEGPPTSGDSTYEVVKEIAVASRDVSVEDSLYETVKELKDPPAQLGLANGTVQLSPDKPPHHPPVLLNGHLSPCTPERGPLCAGVEYASIDLNKKSRHSADMEAKRRSDNANAPSQKPVEDPEEDLPPPVPEKVLDENDNQPVVMNGLMGAGLHNGELHSPPSPAPKFDNHILSDNESAVYSTVNKTNCGDAVNEEDKEHDYSSIAEIKGLVPTSSSCDLYATVRDIYTEPNESKPGEDPASDSTDPGYEPIRVPKTNSSDDNHRDGLGVGGSDAAKAEPDYESVGELGLGQETSRL
ncbi:phosphoprotein associated with glycosphingolipid-enriched microdomains 1 [Anabas testudineus]|uniref:Phosphoprotein membrane anchor with glycosphingolipid microdomains 1 n=1 Tax=Anabas testudineus TaxID=64144 RepID=A0A7N6AM43_ANATE|nr:phosphoprotein associated with glycosphingolipid-enriched microdomains 1 [Anabas testudineus]XP_026203120.1 phosphoprotein associated with glycosphingolipid-enriched microdomains 1 [Anabas testudineus]XP_026203121.1 phosphoprotein associated with glycosphingolipid-enriched microdomains 1 [Anabas testudineus]XP_026203122.1 phosphoprotein associated with glycosphingolipid-enriched microdomains 1 [Anabas testudineus]